MEERDYPHFSAALLTVAEAFGRKVPDGRVRLYFGALLDLPLPRVGRALERAVREGEHFPTIAGLRRLAYERPLATHAPKTRVIAEPVPPGWTPEMREEHARVSFALIAKIMAHACRGADRVRAYRTMAASYPGVAWEEAAALEARRWEGRAPREDCPG